MTPRDEDRIVARVIAGVLAGMTARLNAPTQPTLTVSDAADALRCKPLTVYRMIADGTLTPCRPIKPYLFSAAEVARVAGLRPRKPHREREAAQPLSAAHGA
jgi:excisionase family DNA binding protein